MKPFTINNFTIYANAADIKNAFFSVIKKMFKYISGKENAKKSVFQKTAPWLENCLNNNNFAGFFYK